MSQWGTPHPKLFFAKTTAPTVNDDIGDGACPGSVWIDSTNDKSYVCITPTRGSANWNQTSGAGASFANPMTTTGDMIYSSDNSGTPARRGIGSALQYLAVVSGLPNWRTLQASDMATMWAPLTNGDPAAPELIFDAAGECIMVEVAT